MSRRWRKLFTPQPDSLQQSNVLKSLIPKPSSNPAYLPGIKKHFAQAEGTPFTEYPLHSMRSDNALDRHYNTDGEPLNLPDGTFQETSVVLQLIREAF
jgi:hypothetical protein